MLDVQGPVSFPKGSRELLEAMFSYAGLDLRKYDFKVHVFEVAKGGSNCQGIKNIAVRDATQQGIAIRFQAGDNSTARVARILGPAGTSSASIRQQLLSGVDRAKQNLPFPTQRRNPADVAAELYERFMRSAQPEDWFTAFDLVGNALVEVELVVGLSEYRHELRLLDFDGLLEKNTARKFVLALETAEIAFRVKQGKSANGEAPVRIDKQAYESIHWEFKKLAEELARAEDVDAANAAADAQEHAAADVENTEAVATQTAGPQNRPVLSKQDLLKLQRAFLKFSFGDITTAGIFEEFGAQWKATMHNVANLMYRASLNDVIVTTGTIAKPGIRAQSKIRQFNPFSGIVVFWTSTSATPLPAQQHDDVNADLDLGAEFDMGSEEPPRVAPPTAPEVISDPAPAPPVLTEPLQLHTPGVPQARMTPREALFQLEQMMRVKNQTQTSLEEIEREIVTRIETHEAALEKLYKNRSRLTDELAGRTERITALQQQIDGGRVAAQSALKSAAANLGLTVEEFLLLANTP